MRMPSSLEIAQAARLRPIAEIAGALGLGDDEWEPYGRHKAKIDLSVIDRLADRPDGKLVCVTAITPTNGGEGKTTTSVSLTQGLGAIGRTPVLCLREASLGPVFGVKGGAAGGGYAQIVPMEDLNLHFTGDIHAITAANNLLAAMLEAHLLHGNELGIDPLSITWRRCLDMNDRSLRQLVLGLGGKVNGSPRETGFDITAASEVMAIMAVSRDLKDLRRRLGAITVGQTYAGAPVTAEQLRAAGSMTVLLKEAIKPNLVQTLEGQPAILHCGPFANIAHGSNSLVADRVALKLGDIVVTEGGFAAEFLRSSEPLSKVAFDNRLQVIAHALGTHTAISRVQGGKLKAKREIRVSSLFKEVPAEFLKMIAVHELAHIKEKEHDKDFYKLCTHMEPHYHQYEFDLRVYLTHMDAAGKLAWPASQGPASMPQ